MGFEFESSRRWTFVIAIVVVAMAVASFGFASLSENPLVPDATFDVRDAPGEYDLNRSGTVEMVHIEHVEGEPINMTDLRIRLGTAGNATYSSSDNWSQGGPDLLWEAQLNGADVSRDDRFERGETLSIAKTRGTAELEAPESVRVRLFHIVSHQNILDERVGIT